MQVLAFIAMLGWLYMIYKMLETERYVIVSIDVIVLLYMSTVVNDHPVYYMVIALLNIWSDLRILNSEDSYAEYSDN